MSSTGAAAAIAALVPDGAMPYGDLCPRHVNHIQIV